MSDYSGYCGMSRSDLVREHHTLGVEVQALKDRYQRDVFGLNNEGDPIGGDPAGGYANDLARLKAENESLSLDAARFAYIEQDADSGMSRIYGDDWIAVIDAAISSPENP